MAQSILQLGILGVLPSPGENPIPSSEIFWRLGVTKPTPAQRSSLSRSLARLCATGSAKTYYTEIARPGRGYLYARAR